MSVCYGKESNTQKEIEYSSLVIERALFLDDTNVLLKAYLRRGLAYEKLQKYKLAVHDF